MPVRPVARLSRSDLADLNAFRAVERLRSFTQAAVELGITTSALSHAVRNLEGRLGVRLLNRTSRTVSPIRAALMTTVSEQGWPACALPFKNITVPCNKCRVYD